MDQVQRAQQLLAYAVTQYGRDRLYSIMFGASTPQVTVSEDKHGDIIARLWYKADNIKIEKFY